MTQASNTRALSEPTEVTLARAVLEKHYHEPVYPVTQVCNLLRMWFDAIHAAWTSGNGWEGGTPGKDWHQYGPEIYLAAMKSSMLGRLIYGKEVLRTEKCPEHQGRWSGLEMLERACVHGCQLTGWLPAAEMEG